MKKIIALAMALTMACTVAACGASPAPATAAPAVDATVTEAPVDAAAPAAPAPAAATEEQKFVGVSMPTQSSQRWIQDGDNMKKTLEEKGYKVDLQYAEDIIENQVSQIENMITAGVDVLVIASIDAAALTGVVEKADQNSVKVIAYDRPLLKTPYVTYYATFDNVKVGEQQAQTIVDKLGLPAAAGPFNIELFGGSPDDGNAYHFYNGAMKVLQPYIDEGKLVIQSGQTGMDIVGTLRWDGTLAQSRMENILAANYTDKNLDAVLSAYDGLSIGILAAVKSVGYGTEGKPLPVISGQDAEIPSVKSIMAGEQYSTIFKDTRTLAKAAANMVDAVLQGKEPEINDTTTYDNGVKVVPTFACQPVPVTAENVKEALIDTGYYTDADIA